MNDKQEDLKDEIENVADNVVHPSHETDKEAKKRQPWMPIVGSIIAGAVLLFVLFYFL